MSNLLTQKIQIWNGNDELHVMTLFQLLQWISAIKLEMKTGLKMSAGRGLKTSTAIKRILKLGDRHDTQNLLDHLINTRDDVNEQLGIK